MQTFGIVLFGQTVTMFGSSLGRFAMGIWLYQRSGSVTQFALAMFCAAAPPVLLLPFIGSLVDRWDRRWAMILADIGAGVGVLLLAVLMWSGRAELWHIYLVIAINAAFGTLQYPAFSAATTLLVPREQLGQANGMSTLGQAIVSLLSPMAAGLLTGVVGLWNILLIDGATCIFAIFSLLVIRIPPVVETAEESLGTSFWAESLYGWAYIRTCPGLLGLLLLFASTNFVTGMVQTLIVPMVLTFASSAVLGRVVTGAGLGLLAGGILMSLWRGPVQRVRTILLVLSLQGGVLLVGGLRQNVALITSAAFFYLAGIPIINACSQTIWQSKVPPAVQGRVFAIRQMLASSAIPLATLAAGPLADKVFEPLLAVGGPLANSVGRIIGVGPGRGIGLLFIVLGFLGMTAAILGYRRASLRNVEADLPDAVSHAT